MASQRKGPFGRRAPLPAPEGMTEVEMFPRSRQERLQTLWTYGTVVGALLILGIGMLLRYTVFASQFDAHTVINPSAIASPAPAVVEASPPPDATRAPTATPSPTPTLQPTPSPMPSVTTPEGEPVSPSLSETFGGGNKPKPATPRPKR